MERMKELIECVTGLWPMVKDVLGQKFHTNYLPSSPSDLLLLLLNENNKKDLVGLTIIVTGATSGIGLHSARELAIAGAHVIMACRNIKAANEIINKWKEETAHISKPLNVEVMELDLVSISSVKRFAEDWMRRDIPLHVLINNAGILQMGGKQRFTEDGMEEQMKVNHLSPALLTLLLLPSLIKSQASRVINLNSVAHHYGNVDIDYWNSKIDEEKYSAFKAYASSKLANLMFLKVLATKLKVESSNMASIQCIAVHPGGVSTNIVPGMKDGILLLTPAQGARSVIFCAISSEVTENLENGFVYYSSNCKPDTTSSLIDDLDACYGVWQKTIETLELDSHYIDHLFC